MVARGCKKTPTNSNSTPSGRTFSDASGHRSRTPPSTSGCGRCRCSAPAGTTLHLSAPDSIRSWVERRYATLIGEALEAAGAALSEISFAPLEVGEPAARDDGLNPSYSFERFVIGEGNRFAHAAALAVAEAPSRGLQPALPARPAGARQDPPPGRDRQLSARQRPAALSVRYTTAESFTNEFVEALRAKGGEAFKQRYRDLDVLLVDDVQFLEGKQHTEEEFFHTFNALYEGGSQIVLSSDRLPSQLSTLAERLRDRFEWGLTVAVEPPEPRHPTDRAAPPRPRRPGCPMASARATPSSSSPAASTPTSASCTVR